MMASGGAPPLAFLSTHPSDQDRIARLEALLPQAEQEYRRQS
jgi:Zn-dependent protease with chaperone function